MKPLQKFGAWFASLLAAFFLLATLVFVPWRMGYADSYAISAGPESVGLQFEEIALSPSDQKLTLRAWFMPAESPRALLLYVHGGNTNKQDRFFGGLDYARALHQRGVAILALDLRNHGASDPSRSRKLTFGLEEQHDARAGLEWLRARHPDVPIYAHGNSMGGATLLHMAAGGAKLDGLVLVDPVLHNGDVALGGLSATLNAPRWLVAPSAWVSTHVFNRATLPTDPSSAAADLDLPILLIQDAKDPITRPTHARAFAARNPRVRLVEIDLSPSDGERPGSGAWGSHVSAFRRQPALLLGEVGGFMKLEDR